MLAMVNEVLTHYPNKQVVLAYNMGCVEVTTVDNSSLGDQAHKQQLKFVVPLFHVHVHNWLCQLRFHPQYIVMLGLEDFETCERWLSKSNNLVSTTCLVTQFHRHQAIEQYMMVADKDKYAASSKFELLSPFIQLMD